MSLHDFLLSLVVLYIKKPQLATKFGHLEQKRGCRVKSATHLTVDVPPSPDTQVVNVKVSYEGTIN